jgi:ABC-type phosphate transport system permease subunit
MAERSARRVPVSARAADWIAGAVLGSAGLAAPMVLAFSAVWLSVQACRATDVGDWSRVVGWLAGSAVLGGCGVFCALGPALAGAVLARGVRLGSWLRATSAVPLSVPAFVLLQMVSPWASQALGVPAQHPVWAVVALGWGMALPLWLSLSDVLERDGTGGWMDAAHALGSRTRQILFRLSLPAARSGMVAAFLRAVARASGETMAILLVSGDYSSAWGGADGAATVGAALVMDLPEAAAGGGVWRDLMRAALLLSLWAVALHGLAHRLEARRLAEASE